MKTIDFPYSLYSGDAPLSVRRWVEQFERNLYKHAELDSLTSQCPNEGAAMLFLRLDQARELLRACRTLREKLIIRYFMLNGLAPTELTLARVEGLDPVNCTLYLPKRHWKRNCVTDIDAETVRLQIMYSGNRTSGPLLRGVSGRGLSYIRLWQIVKELAQRTSIAGKEHISPIVLKRTFGREWLCPYVVSRIVCPHCNREIDMEITVPGGNIGTLQKQFSHKHLWSTAHYLRFVMEDVKPDHKRVLVKFPKEV